MKTQIWIAVATYVLAAILKKNCKLPQSLYEILQILGISVFDKTSVTSLFLKEEPQIITQNDQISLF